MGKKQKMKKAASKAAAAAATVAASAAVVDETSSKKNISNRNSSTSSNNNSNKKRNNNKNKGSSIKEKTKEENIQKLLSLAKKMQGMPSRSAAVPKRKSHASSSGSGSSATDSEETDTEKGTEKEDDNDSDDKTNFTVVNVDDDDDNDDDDAITLVQQASAPSNSGKQAGGNVVNIPKYSRGEKKARRLLMKLDLERVPNVSRVTMRKAKNVLLCIDQADVYKCPHTKTLIIFGDVRVEDTSNAAAAQAAERYLNDVNVRPAQEKPGQRPSKDEDKEGNDDDEDDEELAAKLDNGQLDEKDIELVIMQSTCSRQKAIKALLKHNSDVVNAIMELTVG